MPRLVPHDVGGARLPKPPLLAIIFDVDGVLIRSMEKHHEAYQAAFAPLGVDVEQREVFANEGRSSREVIESIAVSRGLDLPPSKLDEMNETKKATFLSFGPMPKYPGVDELVSRLRARGLRLAMVTGTSRGNVEHHFGRWLENFDAIVTADDVTRTKPDPEPYLQALSKLGLAASECVVVENAPLGIRAGKAAGMRVIGVVSTNAAELLKEADVIIPNVNELEGVL